MRAALLACAIVGAGALSTAQAATDAPPPSRIVDRTLLCRMTGVGYPDPVRILDAGASTQDPASLLPASLAVSNGAAGSGTGFVVVTGIKEQRYKSYVSWSRTTCTPSRLRVPLSRKSLSGGPIEFGRHFDCEVPPQIVIRVRGIFKEPVRLIRQGEEAARGELVYGYLAVATVPARTPVVFASLGGTTQRAQLFVSRSRCQED